MKNLIALIALVFLTSMAFSQTPATKQVKKKTATKTEVVSPNGKQVAKPSDTVKSKSVAGVKKDGTPDKRFKDNKNVSKTAAPANGHLKKDGTPDMRYKENKDAATKDKK